MNILALLQQFLGGCSGGTCQAAQSAASAAGSAGGISGLTDAFTMLCRLFGFGC